MKKIIAVFLLTFCLFTIGFAQTPAGKESHLVKGIFKDESSAVITGLSLIFEKDGQKNSSSTDINGEFEINLTAGEYKLTTSPTVSEDFVSYLKIQDGGLNPDNLEYIIKPNQKCCQTASGESFPKIIKISRPPYPPAARAIHAAGNVIVTVKIDKTGKVTATQVVSGHPLLRQLSAVAAGQSLFEPSESAAEREANLTFVFLIRDKVVKGIRHYSNPYRIEVTALTPTIDY